MSWFYVGQNDRTGQGLSSSDVDDADVPAKDAQYIAMFGGDPYAYAYRKLQDSSGERVVLVEQTATYNYTPWETAAGTNALLGADTIDSGGMPPTVTGPVSIGGSGPVTITSTGTASTPTSTGARVATTPAKSGVGLGTVAVVAVAALGVAWAAGWLE